MSLITIDAYLYTWLLHKLCVSVLHNSTDNVAISQNVMASPRGSDSDGSTGSMPGLVSEYDIGECANDDGSPALSPRNSGGTPPSGDVGANLCIL